MRQGISVVVGCVLFAGCQLATPLQTPRADRRPARVRYTPAELSALERCLPQGMTLETRFAPRSAPFVRDTITVREKLEELGARCKDGKLYDAAGKELYFYRVPEYGTPPLPGVWEREGEERRRLEERYHVIEMYADIAPV